MSEFQWMKQKTEKYTEISKLGFYNSKSWKKLRALKLANNPICEHCLKEDKLTPAQMVDHIQPITLTNTELFLEYDNLQSLCNNCHRIKTLGSRSKYSKLKEGERLKEQMETE